MMRILLVVLAALVALAWAPTAATALPHIDVQCNRSATCEGVWFRSPVFVDWSVSGASSVVGCADATINRDTIGNPQGCTAYGSGTATATVTIQLDQTPPDVTGGVADRTPDHAGWYTHPVTFSVTGTDATSGLLSCDPVTYGGPDAASAAVVAACRDRAGNTGSRAFPLRYDATPPQVAAVAAPGDRVVRLSWPAADAATVVRTPGRGRAASTVLYKGPASALTDRGVRNGVQYRYVVTLVDQAGNAASRELATVPGPRLLAPPRRAVLTAPPRLTWTPVRRARYYNVQLFRDGRKILTAWPRRPALQLETAWRFRGRRHRLTAGSYRWFVWPGVGSRDQQRYGRRIGQRSFTVQ